MTCANVCNLLCPFARDLHLKELLDGYKFFPGLVVHWVFVGPSGHDTRPPSGGVLRSYDHCTGAPDEVFKTIVNSFYVSNIARHTHGFEFRCAEAPRHFGECHCTLAKMAFMLSATRPTLLLATGWLQM